MFWPKYFCLVFHCVVYWFSQSFCVSPYLLFQSRGLSVLLCIMLYFTLWTYSEVTELFLLYLGTCDVPCKYCCCKVICRFVTSCTSGESSTVALRLQCPQDRSNYFRRNGKTIRKINNKVTIHKRINFKILTFQGRCYQFNFRKRN
jgi:hypothetical protein